MSYTHIGDIDWTNNNGDILRQYGDLDLSQFHGMRVKQICAYKLVKPGRTGADEEIALTMAGQMYLMEDGRAHQLTDVDLFDEYSALIWNGDLLLDDVADRLRIYYSCHVSGDWGIRVYGVFE